MDNEELHRLDLLCFDEKSETWYLDTRESRRLRLTRQTLDGLIHLYNSVHTGNPLLLGDRKTLRRLEENNQRLTETIRDLYLYIDRQHQRRADRVALRFLRAMFGVARRRRR